MKTFLCVVRRVLAVLLALIFALLGAACLIAIPLSNNYSAMISMAVAMPTTAKSGGSNPQYFTSDYSSAAAVQEDRISRGAGCDGQFTTYIGT